MAELIQTKYMFVYADKYLKAERKTVRRVAKQLGIQLHDLLSEEQAAKIIKALKFRLTHSTAKRKYLDVSPLRKLKVRKKRRPMGVKNKYTQNANNTNKE